jgi:hypothetical protein
MKQMAMAMAVLVAVACAGCTTAAKKYKGVSVETDGAGKVIRRVESESVEQTSSTAQELKLKHIEY